MSPFHCENNFAVPIIKLRMFGGYISTTGTSTEVKTQVISICTLFADFSNSKDLEIPFNLPSMKVCHFQLPFIKL